MTDNEIIKALECCANICDNGFAKCNECPRFEEGSGCTFRTMKDTLDLINRLKANEEKNENIIRLADKTIEKQQAEIERLECEVENYRDTLKDMMERESKYYNESKMYKTSLGSVCKELETAKLEARKEFAERFKEEVAHIPAWGRVAEKKIDNLLKEMEGEE